MPAVLEEGDAMKRGFLLPALLMIPGPLVFAGWSFAREQFALGLVSAAVALYGGVRVIQEKQRSRVDAGDRLTDPDDDRPPDRSRPPPER
jgi:hypothetical protein